MNGWTGGRTDQFALTFQPSSLVVVDLKQALFDDAPKSKMKEVTLVRVVPGSRNLRFSCINILVGASGSATVCAFVSNRWWCVVLAAKEEPIQSQSRIGGLPTSFHSVSHPIPYHPIRIRQLGWGGLFPFEWSSNSGDLKSFSALKVRVLRVLYCTVL